MGQTIDLTIVTPQKKLVLGKSDLVLVGMPVYSGRLPPLAVERFNAIEGAQNPIVTVVVYGNRHFDDSLVELYDLCKEQGFTPVAAGAFIGEHSFSTDALPLSSGRPDTKDIEIAHKFGQEINSTELSSNRIPGNRPYRLSTTTTGCATSVDAALCTKCNRCIKKCPTQGIQMTKIAATASPENCIWCMACQRVCPENAQKITHEKIKASAQKLNNFFSKRKEPETFIS